MLEQLIEQARGLYDWIALLWAVCGEAPAKELLANVNYRRAHSSISECKSLSWTRVKVNMNFFMPDQGPNPGIVNVITKSGTNHYHGEVYEYLRNTLFDARNFFSPGAERLNRNQFGFVLGGPLRVPKLFDGRDRVWFSANYEGDRQISRFSASTNAATAAMLSGDFSRTPATLYDPETFSAVTGTRSAFPENVIPASRINPTTSKLLKYYRPGMSESSRINLYGNPGRRVEDDQSGGRVDAALSGRQNLSASYFWQDSPVTAEGLMPLTGASYLSAAKVATVQHTFAIAPALVAIARFGFSYSQLFLQGEAASQGELLTSLGITGTPDVRGITGISIQGYAGLGRSAGTNGNVDHNYQGDYGLIWNRGRALVQTGFGARHHRLTLQNANSNALGSLSFQTSFTAQLARPGSTGYTPVANTGNAFGDFLLGFPTNGAVLGLPPYDFHYWQLYPYVQTAYRLAPNLTLNAGLSWYHNTIPDPQGVGREVPHILNLSTGLLEYAALGQVDPKVLKPQYHTWTPRLGLSWQPTRKTVVRAGAGIYYGESFLFETQFAMNAPPFTNTRTIVNSNPTPTWVLGSNIFPAGDSPRVTPDYASTLAAGYSPFAQNPDGKMPMITQLNFSIQQSLGGQTMVEASYLGNQGHHLQNRYDINQCRPANGVPCVYSARPWTRYTSVLYSSNDGNSNFHSLILRAQRRMPGEATFVADYIYSKNIVDGWEGGGATGSQISYCRACDRALSSIHVPHRFVASFVAPLPFGRGRRFASQASRLVHLLVADWSVSGIVTFSSGGPFTVNAANNTASVFSDYRANRFCSGVDASLSSNLRSNGLKYFDTSCFQRPAPGFFGNSGRNIMLGPGVNNFDVSVQKGLRLNERAQVSLRGEFFNALNRALFNDPGSRVESPLFGVVTSAREPRLIQVGAKLTF